MDWLLLIFVLILAVGVGLAVYGGVEKYKHKSTKDYHNNMFIIGIVVAAIGLIGVIVKVVLNMKKKNTAKNMMNYGPQDMGYNNPYDSGMYGPQDMGYGSYGASQDMGLDTSGMVFDQYGNPIPISSLVPPPPSAPVAQAPAPVVQTAPVQAPASQTTQSSCAPQNNNCCNSMPMNPFNMNPMMGMNMGMNPWMMYPQPPVFKVKCSKDD